MSAFAAVDDLLEGAVSSGALAGGVAVVADRDGVIYDGCAGTLPDGTATMFRIASMTKAVATVAVLQCVEEGLVDLDADVSSVLPAFAELQVLDGFDQATPRLRAPATQPTVRQLLTHTSGCGYFFTNAGLTRWHEVTGEPDVLTGLKSSLRAPLVADPGTTWEYGVSTDWAGQLVEALRGETLGEAITERITGPLGMTDTTFAPDATQRARLLGVKSRAADGSLEDSHIDLPDNPEFDAGGSGLYATASDYLLFLRALLGGGELDGARILADDTVELMFSDQLGDIELPELIESAAPELANDIPRLPFKQGWGCGLALVLEDMPGMRRAGSGNWAGLMNSYYWVDRKTGIAAVFFTQILPFFDQRVIETVFGFELAVYASLDAAPSTARSASESTRLPRARASQPTSTVLPVAATVPSGSRTSCSSVMLEVPTRPPHDHLHLAMVLADLVAVVELDAREHVLEWTVDASSPAISHRGPPRAARGRRPG